MTSQGRRKHSACLFRMRENCPFRRLKRSMCSDSRSSLVPAGGQWGTSQTLSGAAAAAAVPSAAHPQEECSAMDTDAEAASAGMSYTPSGERAPRIGHEQRGLTSRDTSSTSMDLDAGVDPETGERAQG